MTGLQLSDAPLFVPEQQPARIKGHRWMIGPTSVLFKIQTCWLGHTLFFIQHVFFWSAQTHSNHHSLSVCKMDWNYPNLDPSSKFCAFWTDSSKYCDAERTAELEFHYEITPSPIWMSMCVHDLGAALQTHAANTDGNWERAMKEANLLFISGCLPRG